jgi:hypothetical protein
MSIKLVNDDSLTNIANAIRIKGSISGTLEFPDGFVSAIQAIPSGITPSGTLSITSNGTYDVGSFASADVNVSGGGGDTDTEDWFVVGNVLSVYSNNRVSFIRQCAFMCNGYLVGASFASATRIFASAFRSCSSLAYINAPNVVSIYSDAFAHCSPLTSIDFPNCTSLHTSAFAGCTQLEEVSLPRVTYIASSVFSGCSALRSIYMPALKKTSGADIFGQCRSLSFISLDALTETASSTFRYCTGLTTARFSKLSYIKAGTFASCSSLMSLYLLNESVASLAGINAFFSTPMSLSSYTGTFGSIYVPASLVSDYKVARNWSTYADRITAYEE